jgi:peptidyl-prolyl cis-trans isomerase C
MFGPRLLIVFAIVSATFVAAGCSGSGDIPDDAVCSVGDTTVSKDRQDQAYAAARAQAKARTGTAPKGAEADALRRQVAAQLVTAAAWRSVAEADDLEVSDKDVKRAERELVKTGFGGDRKRYESQLEVEGRTAAQARADLRDQLFVERVRDHATKGAHVSAKEAKAWLEAHPSDFGGTPRTRDVQHVLIRAGGKAEAKDDAAAKAFAERTRAKVEGASEAEFGAIAKRFSDDPSYGPTGGSFTYQAGTIDPAFEQVAFALDEDEVSEPVKTPLGWHIIVARGEPVDAKLPKLSEVEDQVRDAALAAERDEAIADAQQRVDKLVRRADCRSAYRVKATKPTTTTSAPDSSTTTKTAPVPANDPEPETAKP